MPGAQGLGINLGTGATGSFTVKVVIDPRALAAFLRSDEGPAMRASMEAGRLVKQEAQLRAGKSTGKLRDHMVTRVVQTGNLFEVHVGTDVPYAMYHHDGSDAVNGKLMVFNPRQQGRMWYGPTRSDGMVFITKRAAIPGTHFLTEALAVVHI